MFKSLQFLKPDKDWSAIYWICLCFVVLFSLTYARWGLLIVDTFHDAYVAWQILLDKSIYVDINYLYGPFVPYFYLILFKIFGVNLTPLYIAGGFICLSYTLVLYFLARQILNIPYSLAGIALFWGTCAFSPALKNFIFPYTASASYGTLFSLLTLAGLIYYLRYNKSFIVYISAIFCGLSMLVKHEFAFTALLIWILFWMLRKILYKKDVKIAIPPSLIVIMIPVVAYSFLAAKIGIEPLYKLLLPGTFLYNARYFQSNFLKTGFSPDALLAGLTALALLVLSGAVIISLFYYYLKLKEKYGINITVILTGIVLLIIAFAIIFPDLINFLGFMLINNFLNLFAGLNFIILIVLIYSIKTDKDSITNQILIFMGLYSIIISFRTPLYLSFTGYAPFYIPVHLIIFIYFLTVFLPGKFLTRFKTPYYMAGVNIFIAVLILLFSGYDLGSYIRKNAHVSGPDSGFILVNDNIGNYFQRTINYIVNTTKPDDKIFVIPEEVGIYFLSQRSAPSSIYYLNPALMGPSSPELKRFLKSLKNNPPVVIVSSNFPERDFGIASLEKEYKPLFSWIKQNYSVAGKMQTEFPIGDEKFYEMTVYRNNNNPAENENYLF